MQVFDQQQPAPRQGPDSPQDNARTILTADQSNRPINSVEYETTLYPTSISTSSDFTLHSLADQYGITAADVALSP
jgi:hypothetical protein